MAKKLIIILSLIAFIAIDLIFVNNYREEIIGSEDAISFAAEAIFVATAIIVLCCYVVVTFNYKYYLKVETNFNRAKREGVYITHSLATAFLAWFLIVSVYSMFFNDFVSVVFQLPIVPLLAISLYLGLRFFLSVRSKRRLG